MRELQITAKIVGIHGLANKPPKEVLTLAWEMSLREGIAASALGQNPSFNFSMVYWADLLYAQPMHEKTGFEFDPLYNAEPYVAAPSDSLRTYDDGALDDVRGALGSALGTILDFTHKAFGTDAISKFVIDRVLKDLSFYYDPKRKILDRQGTMDVARAVLMDEVKKALLEARKGFDGELTVIAYSMGAIIAYDVLPGLGQTHPDFQIENFITIGAPLGLPTVKANVHEANKHRLKQDRLRTPTTVTRNWINYSDRKDPVCLDNHLRDDFGPNTNQVQVVDDIVLNDYRGAHNENGEPASPGAGKPNHHKSYGYLRTPELSRFLAGMGNAPKPHAPASANS